MRPTPPPYRIIYNWDGAPHGYDEVPQSMESFLERVYAPLEQTQVGALFWCIGEHAARWPSDVLEQLGDIHGRRYEGAWPLAHTENIRLMLERGEDPQAALIERGHGLGLQVYASVRMNDNHFNGAQIADLPTLHHTELTELRRRHPEWLLGDRTSEWFALSWDMSVPEVRRHRLEHIREVCERYDWDGVELDWQRHAFHLPVDDAFRLRYVLTDLQRAVRRCADEIGRKRGRPLFVTVRVAGNLHVCEQIGYDLPAWLEEGLVDIVVPAGNGGTDDDVDVAGFTDLCRPHGVAVYPGFDDGLPGPWVGPEPADDKDRLRTRAIAARHWDHGADGIYAFNWHAGRDTRRELLNQVGRPESLAATDKVHAATHRVLRHEGEWRGAYNNDRVRGTVPVALKETITDSGPVIPLDAADDFETHPPRALELRVHLGDWARGDEVAVRWDGEELPAATVTYDTTGDRHGLSGVHAAAWLRFALSPGQVKRGRHLVEVILRQRHPQLTCDLVLTDVELVVAYSEALAGTLLDAGSP